MINANEILGSTAPFGCIPSSFVIDHDTPPGRVIYSNVLLYYTFYHFLPRFLPKKFPTPTVTMLLRVFITKKMAKMIAFW